MKPKHVKDTGLNNVDVRHLYALTIVKEQLEIMERNFFQSIDESNFGKLCKSTSSSLKMLHESIDLVGVVDDVIQYQEHFIRPTKSKKN